MERTIHRNYNLAECILEGREGVSDNSRTEPVDWRNSLNKMRNTGWGVGFLVKHKGFGFDYAKFEVVPWTVWSLEERTSLETPIWKH